MHGAMAERIHKENARSKVVLYLNGTAAYPLCSFSAAIVQILSQLGVAFTDVNVQEDGELRQAVMDYARWPSIPQLYILGEFIGGADIIREMFQTGELQDLLEDRGIRYTRAA